MSVTHSQPESTGTSGGEGVGAFTPGPWYVLDQRATTLRAQGWVGVHHDVILISNYAPSDIRPDHCDCIVARIDFSNRPEELGESNFADARLIAAAPDYAAAAEQMLSHEDAGGDGWWKGFEMLKAAHAKALGADPKAGA